MKQKGLNFGDQSLFGQLKVSQSMIIKFKIKMSADIPHKARSTLTKDRRDKRIAALWKTNS